MSYKVLIVDDSKLARMAIAKALNALYPDWTKIEAASADEAVTIAEQSPVDLILLDFNMPGRNGLDFAAEIRAAHPTMPVAIISANHQKEIVTRAREVGAVFLPKPLTEQALGEFLDGAVQSLKASAP